MQFKRGSDSNEISENVAMCLLIFVVAKSPEASLITRLTLKIDIGAPTIDHRGMEGQERIYATVQVVIYLLNSYATDDVVAKI